MSIVDNETLEKWRDTPGHESEEKFVVVLSKKLGVQEVPDDFEKKRNTYEDLVYCRNSAEDDWNGEGDVTIYHPRKDKYFHIDLTTSGDAEVISNKKADCREKNEQARREGRNAEYHVLVLPKYVVDQAFLGSEKDIEDIRVMLTDLLND